MRVLHLHLEGEAQLVRKGAQGAEGAARNDDAPYLPIRLVDWFDWLIR